MFSPIKPDVIAPYRDPFEGMAEAYLPEKLKEFFPLAANIYNQNPLIQLAVKKWAEYAVTDLEYDPNNDVGKQISDKYEEIFEKQLHLKRFLIKIGLDYMLFGNAFVSVLFPVSKKFICKECGKGDDESRISPIHIVDLAYNGSKFKGTCPKCEQKVEFTVIDEYEKRADNIMVKTWEPVNIDILPNRWNNEEYFYWSPPDDTVDNIKNGEMRIVNSTPTEVLDAINQNRTVELDNVFHFKIISPSDVNSEWGKSVLLCAFKTIYYIAQLRNASEAIAFEHITPLRIIFPMGTEGIPPAAALMTRYRDFIEGEFEQWRQDPNHVCISPVPMGQEYLGGQGRAYLPAQELEIANQELFLAFGLPQGLIQGQATWAGNSISLRIVENAFLTYRDQLQEVVDWIQLQIQNYLNLEPCEINLKEFKMLDDIQHKQMVVNLSMAGKIPIRNMLELMGFDYDEVIPILREEAVEMAQIQAEAQAEMIKIQSKMQQDMEADYMAKTVEDGILQSQNMMDATISMIRSFMNKGATVDQAIKMVQGIQQQQQMQMQMQMQMQQAEEARRLFLADRMGKAQWSNVRAQREGTMYDIMSSANPQKDVQSTGQSVQEIVQRFPMWDAETQKRYLDSVYQKNPAFYEMLVDTLNSQGVPIGVPHPMADNQGGQ